MWVSGLSTGHKPKGHWLDSQWGARAWVAGQVPSRGCVRDNHTLMFLSLSFFPPSPLWKSINQSFKKKFFKSLNSFLIASKYPGYYCIPNIQYISTDLEITVQLCGIPYSKSYIWELRLCTPFCGWSPEKSHLATKGLADDEYIIPPLPWQTQPETVKVYRKSTDNF